MKYKDYGAIHAIFQNIREDHLKSMAEAYASGVFSDYTPLSAVIALAKSDGLTDAEIDAQILSADWCPKNAAE